MSVRKSANFASYYSNQHTVLSVLYCICMENSISWKRIQIFFLLVFCLGDVRCSGAGASSALLKIEGKLSKKDKNSSCEKANTESSRWGARETYWRFLLILCFIPFCLMVDTLSLAVKWWIHYISLSNGGYIISRCQMVDTLYIVIQRWIHYLSLSNGGYNICLCQMVDTLSLAVKWWIHYLSLSNGGYNISLCQMVDHFLSLSNGDYIISRGSTADTFSHAVKWWIQYLSLSNGGYIISCCQMVDTLSLAVGQVATTLLSLSCSLLSNWCIIHVVRYIILAVILLTIGQVADTVD